MKPNPAMHVGGDYHSVAGSGITSRENLEYNLRHGVKHITAQVKKRPGGGGWDAVPDGRGALKATKNTGGYVAFEHAAGRLRATALVGGARISNPMREDLPDLFRGAVASLTTFYDIDESLWIGMELDHGRRRDFKATTADATRVQFALQFSF